MPATPYAVDDLPVELIHMIIEDIVNQHDVDGLASFVTSSPIICRAFLSRREELLRNRLPKDRRSARPPQCQTAALPLRQLPPTPRQLPPPQARERTAGEDMVGPNEDGVECLYSRRRFSPFAKRAARRSSSRHSLITSKNVT
ncbi:hypothetical protein Cob_v002503 [Colletotrichum orbiculare MAFF 240422]|uniref:Uncharacterized protein n=1 Tax=Colletotrichum orbiculare (strain 104-T / ATCC 96160 / CBS 514.97 / LARS 414 / MAFF 240422) TaxID=1213857 RepID=A0A484G336_COLOR|nr:hypothetical protein Cob_v002503 [Colletotrichum orbiculare MAFF 240422]